MQPVSNDCSSWPRSFQPKSKSDSEAVLEKTRKQQPKKSSGELLHTAALPPVLTGEPRKKDFARKSDLKPATLGTIAAERNAVSPWLAGNFSTASDVH